MVKAAEVVIITGVSGAGKSQAIKCLEDIGFFCIDNLPTTLLPTFVRLCMQSEHTIERVALVIDVRGAEFLTPLFDILKTLRAEGHVVKIVFLDASNEVLARRFSESRRPHPLAAGKSAMAGIAAERQMLTRLRGEADLIIDTSTLTIHDLKRFLSQAFVMERPTARIALSLVSFGYKHGLPFDADVVFDTRFLPSPHFIDDLRPLTGLDSQIGEFLMRASVTKPYLERLTDLLDFVTPLCEEEGRAYLTIALGCTGGHHRSVFLAERLAGHFRECGYQVNVRHRDIERT
ncbi:MAG: RNase adapter RapZ [candidate division NC10 bacterium]|nr:RNase adapter RapZ [candidate division NC10 bacterium]MDE2320789.1 RNase adapter RapZ [candidate division NC10 bacterium]